MISDIIIELSDELKEYKKQEQYKTAIKEIEDLEKAMKNLWEKLNPFKE